MSLSTAELLKILQDHSDEEDDDAPFTYIPVETQIKVENKELSFIEEEIEEDDDGDENLVISSKQTKTKVNHNENEQSVMQLKASHGTTSLTHTEPEEHPLLTGMVYFPPSNSLLQERLEKEKCKTRRKVPVKDKDPARRKVPVKDKDPARRKGPDIICNDCGKRFRFPCDFKRHALMHSEARNFECNECHKKFKMLSHLKMHIYRFHVVEKQFACKHCGKKYATQSDLKVHEPIHNREPKRKCPTCSEAFITAKDLRTHMQIHTKKREHECEVCKRKFLRRAHLQKHVLVVHKKFAMTTEIRIESDSPSMPLPGAEPCVPEISLSDEEDGSAPFTFIPVETQIQVENTELCFTEEEIEEEEVDENLVKHSKRIKTEVNHNENEQSVMQLMASHGTTVLGHIEPGEHPLLTGMVYFPPTHSLLRERLQKDVDQPRRGSSDEDKDWSPHEKDKEWSRRKGPDIICNDCGKRFRFPCDFKRHALMHSEARNFECNECQKKFKLLSHLKMHIYRFHVVEKPYACKHCGKKYATQTDLKVHEPIHNPERPHVCPTCSRGFITPKDLRKHMQIHNKTREHECDVCKRKFLRRAHLQKHVLAVHKK